MTPHPRRLNGEVHTKQELRMRSVEGEGGLCALAAYYQAFYHTFLSRLVVMLVTLRQLSRSQLREESYQSMRSRLFELIGEEESGQPDAQMLETFHKCETCS